MTWLHIENSKLVLTTGVPVGAGAVEGRNVGGFQWTDEAVAFALAALAVPDAAAAARATLTAEEVECALLERELDQARDDGLISTWGMDHDFAGLWSIFWREGERHSKRESAKNRYSALVNTVDRVREMRQQREAAAAQVEADRAVADAEARITAVFHAGLIDELVFPVVSNNVGAWQYALQSSELAGEPNGTRRHYFHGDTRLAAATAAVEWAEALVADAPVLPDVVSICVEELASRGWWPAFAGPCKSPEWTNRDDRHVARSSDETHEEWVKRALREARKAGPS